MLTPFRCGLAAICCLLYSLCDVLISRAVHAAGGWGSWQAVTFLLGVAGFVVFIACWLAMELAAARHR